MNHEKYKVRLMARIASEFAAHRKQHIGKTSHYPKRLRKLAVSALARGLKPSEIATAAGLTPKSIHIWSQSAVKVEAPSELRLVSIRPETVVKTSSQLTSPAKIRIGQNVTIELLSSELSLGLLQSLSQLGSSL